MSLIRRTTNHLFFGNRTNKNSPWKWLPWRLRSHNNQNRFCFISSNYYQSNLCLNGVLPFMCRHKSAIINCRSICSRTPTATDGGHEGKRLNDEVEFLVQFEDLSNVKVTKVQSTTTSDSPSASENLDTTSLLMEDLYRYSAKPTLKNIVGSLRQFVFDSAGSQFVLNQLAQAADLPKSQIDTVIKELSPHFYHMSRQHYACKVLLRLIELCDDSLAQNMFHEHFRNKCLEMALSAPQHQLLEALILKLSGKLNHICDDILSELHGSQFKLAKSPFGSYIIRIIPTHGSTNMCRILTQELSGKLSLLAADDNGRFVVENLITRVPSEDINVIIAELKSKLLELSCDKQGRFVVAAAMLRHDIAELNLYDILKPHTVRMIENPNFAYILGSVLQSGRIQLQWEILNELRGNLVRAASDGINTVELLFKYGTSEMHEIMINELLPYAFRAISHHSFALTLAAAIQYSDATFVQKLYVNLKSRLLALATCKGGSTIIRQLLQRSADEPVLKAIRHDILQTLRQHFFSILTFDYGRKLYINLLLGKVLSDTEVHQLIRPLSGKLAETLLCSQAAQVISSLVTAGPDKVRQSLFNELFARAPLSQEENLSYSPSSQILAHKESSWVVENLFICGNEVMRKKIIDHALSYLKLFPSASPYYCHRMFSHILSTECSANLKTLIFNHFFDQAVLLSTTRNGSMLLQALISNSTENSRKLYDKLNPCFDSIVYDEFGHHIVLCWLASSSYDLLPQILAYIRPRLFALCKNRYGGAIVRKVLMDGRLHYRDLVLSDLLMLSDQQLFALCSHPVGSSMLAQAFLKGSRDHRSQFFARLTRNNVKVPYIANQHLVLEIERWKKLPVVNFVADS